MLHTLHSYDSNPTGKRGGYTWLVRLAFFILPILATAQASATQGTKMPDGLWEVRTTVEIAGKGNATAKMGETKILQCVNANSAKGTTNTPAGAKRCDNASVEKLTNKTRWAIQCTDGSTGDAEMNHNSKDSYTVTSSMTAKGATTRFVSQGRKIADTCTGAPNALGTKAASKADTKAPSVTIATTQSGEK